MAANFLPAMVLAAVVFECFAWKHERFVEFDLASPTTPHRFGYQRASPSNLPPDIRALDGRRVYVDGFTLGTFGSGTATSFLVLRSYGDCFHPPEVDSVVFATFAPGFVLPMFDKRRFFGRLHIKVEKDEDGRIQSLYRMDVERIEKVPVESASWVQYLPCLLLVAAVGLVTAITRLIRQRRRDLLGLCMRCGYDLRSRPVRCPECGNVRAGATAGTPVAVEAATPLAVFIRAERA